MSKPLLKRLESTNRYEKSYQIYGFDHLIVEANFDDPDHGRPTQYGWSVLDTRYTVLNKYRRHYVIYLDTLAEVRSWIRAGGPILWDPEKRKTDRDWKPIPDGWTPAEARSQVPRRSDPGVGRKRRVGTGPSGDRAVRGGGGGQDRDRDPETGGLSDRPLGPLVLTGKKYAVCPGWVRSVNDGQRHFIGFGALTWLYGVNPNECVLMDGERERGWSLDVRESLIWLYPQKRYEDYESMKQELARGEDAFKLVEP